MKTHLHTLVFASALLGLSCTTQTGILVEIWAADDVARIDAIKLVAASELADGLFSEDYVEVIEPSKSLHEEPHRVMLRRGEELDGPVMIVVAGVMVDEVGNDIVVGEATVGPIKFIDGEVLKVKVTLEAKSRYIYEPGATCLYVDDTTQIGLPGDLDCDGVGDDDDCGPLDPLDVGMGDPDAEEICDGVDNDCDAKCDEGHDMDGDGFYECGSIVNEEGTCIGSGQDDCNDMDPFAYPGATESCTFDDLNCDGIMPDGRPCFTRNEGECVIGDIPCNSTNPLIDCEPRADSVPLDPAICNQYEDCLSTLAGLQYCFNQTVRRVSCSIRFESATPESLCAPEFYALPTPNGGGAGSCGWKLVDGLNLTVPYTLGLVVDPGDPPSSTLLSCTGFLVVVAASAVDPADVYIAHTNADGARELHRITLLPVTVADCSMSLIACLATVEMQ